MGRAMKKFLVYASAVVAALCAMSCQMDKEAAPAQEVAVSISLEMPQSIAVKSLSQAENTDIVYYEIWNSDWSKQLYPVDNTTLASAVVSGKTATIDLTLVSSQTYNFIFWAQNEACGAYNVNDLKKVVVDYSVISTAATRDQFDAFYAVKQIAVNGPINETIVLTRPFAQINFGTDTMNTTLGAIEVGETKVTIPNLATVFNTIDGVGETQTTAPVTFVADGLATTEKLSTNNKKYTWVTMDYVLMMGEKDNAEIVASFDLGMENPVVHTVSSVPMKKNYRTNIVGDLFTTDAVLSIYVEPAFNTPDEVVGL